MIRVIKNNLIYSCTVDQMYRGGHLAPAKILAGEHGLSRYVRWFHVIEVMDKLDLFHGNELVITTGYDIGNNPILQSGLVQRLNNKKISALIIKKDYITQISKKMKESANELSLPLFVIENSTDLIQFTRKVSNFLIKQSNVSNLMSNFLFQLIDNKTKNKEDVLRRARMLGYPIEKKFLLFIFNLEINEEQKNYDIDVKIVLEKLTESILYYKVFLNPFIIKGKQIIILVPIAKEVENYIWEWAKQIAIENKISLKHYNPVIVISDIIQKYTDIATHIEETIKVMEITNKINNSGVHLVFNYLPYLVLKDMNKDSIKEYISRTIGEILFSDNVNKLDLLGTLENFFLNDCNINNTSQKMFIHRNTLVYRIQKIEKILGRSLSSYKNRFVLDLALHLYSLYIS